MLGITDIDTYLQENRIQNLDKNVAIAFDGEFIKNKIGIKATAIKAETDEASDLCCQAFAKLQKKER